MAGMGDNPLVGEYTKGISKGRDYFVALDARIKREKYDPKVIVSDLEMGLIRDQKERVKRSISISGLGGFGPKLIENRVATKKVSRQKMAKNQRENVSGEAMVLLLRMHFCG